MNQSAELYWTKKLLILLHDPPYKPFEIRLHERKVEDILRKLNLLDEYKQLREEIHRSDVRASASDRLPLRKGDSETGIEWTDPENVELVHPLSSRSLIAELAFVDLSNPDGGPELKVGGQDVAIEEVVGELVSRRNELSEALSSKIVDSLGKFGNDRRRAFLWLWRNLEKLHGEGGLRGLLLSWLPADTRTPDHSVYDHLITASALVENDTSLLSVDIGGIRSFITQSRKVRDLWASSYLVSMLSTAALMEAVMTLGPDTVIYPDLRENPLVDLYLLMEGVLTTEELKSLWGGEGFERRFARALLTPTVPGTMTLFVPSARAQDLTERMKERMMGLMERLVSGMRDYLTREVPGIYFPITQNDLPHPLKIRTATVSFEDVNDLDNEVKNCADSLDCIRKVLRDRFPSQLWMGEETTLGGKVIESLAEILWIRNRIKGYRMRDTTLYPIAYRVLQLKMAAEKVLLDFKRRAEEGFVRDSDGREVPIRKRCRICGIRNPVMIPDGAKDERDGWRAFLASLKGKSNLRWIATLLDDDEPLCPICLTKRLLRSLGSRGEGLNLLLEAWAYLLRKDKEDVKETLEELGVWEELTEFARKVPTLDDIANRPVKDKIKGLFALDESSLERISAERLIESSLGSALEAVANFYNAIREREFDSDDEWVLESVEALLKEIGAGFPEMISRTSMYLDIEIDKVIERFKQDPMSIPGSILYDSTWQKVVLAIDKSRELFPDLDDEGKIPEWRRQVEEFLDTLKKFHDEYASPTNYLALIYFDGDRMGDWLTGIQLVRKEVKWAERIHKKLKNMLKEELGDEPLSRAYKLPTPSYHRTLSRIVRQLGTVVFPQLVDSLGGFVFFSGGDDLLAAVPSSKVPELLVALHTAFSAELLRMGNELYVMSLGQKATASSGLVVAHRLIPMREMIETVYHEEKVAKGDIEGDDQSPEGGRDRSSIVRLTRGQFSGRAVLKGDLLDRSRAKVSLIDLTKKISGYMDGRGGVKLSKSFLRDMDSYLELLASTVKRPKDDENLLRGLLRRCVRRNLSGEDREDVIDELVDLYLELTRLEEAEVKKHAIYHAHRAITFFSKEVGRE